MLTKFRKWLAIRQLITISRSKNFWSISPELVAQALRSYALSKLDLTCARYTSKLDPQELEAILSIWQLAKAAYESDQNQRSQWHTVIANCNIIYEQLVSCDSNSALTAN